MLRCASGQRNLMAWICALRIVGLAARNRKSGERGKERIARSHRTCGAKYSAVAEKQLPRGWALDVEPGVRIAQIVRPIESIGCYVPGGRFSLMSTLLMTVIPAMVAGVRRIVVASPKPNEQLLAAAHILGVRRVARIGGAQAIAALAYGTKTIAPVDKIFGPGNRFVTAAKQLVSSDCAIDLPAGPTEAIVLAGPETHDGLRPICWRKRNMRRTRGVFWSPLRSDLAVQDATSRFASNWRRCRRIILRIFRRGGRSDFAGAFDEGRLRFRKPFCAGTLEPAGKHRSLLKEIRAAGTVFVGPWSAQPFGDYASGSNHVLPTAGWARARGGLSAGGFCEMRHGADHQPQRFRAAWRVDVQILARAEGLLAHSNAVEIRR